MKKYNFELMNNIYALVDIEKRIFVGVIEMMTPDGITFMVYSEKEVDSKEIAEEVLDFVQKDATAKSTAVPTKTYYAVAREYEYCERCGMPMQLVDYLIPSEGASGHNTLYCQDCADGEICCADCGCVLTEEESFESGFCIDCIDCN